ncbi:hypothetical protein NDU88_004182 [Pleurodeles waltl]|uniref:Uncharacterized protein n=1 Tax=Pleurodeles waltl TaxID=8319 RepID=A0AAV7VFG4_PLEWA|nr:hypothetical protein NDU88_004182 [Pleurodeles waltl]
MQVTTASSLVGIVTRLKGKKTAYKLLQLALVLSKRRVAINWIGTNVPHMMKWLDDVGKWSLAAEVHLRLARRDKKVEEYLDT